MRTTVYIRRGSRPGARPTRSRAASSCATESGWSSGRLPLGEGNRVPFGFVHLGQIAAQTPDKPAVIMAGSGEVRTFRELNEESNRLAQLMRAEGLRPGDHIAFMLE